MTDLIIVGGGVAGLFAAISAKKNGANVKILEKNDSLGKKILVTGNGRCNFTNEVMDSSYFVSSSGDKDSFVGSVLNSFDNSSLIKMLEELGMSYYLREGYYYPKTDEAVTFRDTLINEVERLGIQVIYNFNLRSIEKVHDGFELSNKIDIYHAKKVILSTGGNAAPKTGSSGDAYYYLENLGHSIIKPLPALTTLKADYPETLLGVNALANISLLINGQNVASERGFIKYYKGMLSGIPIYQLSLKAVPALNRGDSVKVSVDFISDSNMVNALNREGLSVRKALCQSINPKIVDSYYKEDDNMLTEQLDDEDKEGIIQLFSNVNYEIIGFGSFDVAQSTYGGVDISEINMDTMESKVCPGLFLVGEIIDITGRCGGYNIQWAASTGVIAGRKAAENGRRN